MATQQISPSPQQKLPLRDHRWLKSYLECGDATQASIAIGYKPNTARTIGYRMLQKPRIQAAIAYEMEKNGLTATYVLESIKAIVENEKTRAADKLTGLTLLGKNLKLWSEQLDINVTHDLADRVAQARQRVAPKELLATEIPTGER